MEESARILEFAALPELPQSQTFMEQELLFQRQQVFMSSHLFESFSKMINKLPPKGVVTATQREYQMLENDLATNRPVSPQEAHSIMSFCEFLATFQTGAKLSPVVLPPGDTAFYRRTTDRLIEAGELPASAHERFDEAFTMPLLRSLEKVD